MSNLNISIGRKIKLARIDRGLTQQQLADLLNATLPAKYIIERSMISRWEKGIHFPKKDRQEALESILKIKLGKPSRRLHAGATYIPHQEQITERLMYILKDCEELWVTSTSLQSGAWKEMSILHTQFEKLRKSKTCLVKELYYVQTAIDMQKILKLISAKYPNYRLGIRVAPGQPLPILFIPDKNFGLLLSSSDDNLKNVGLELDGEVASFCEHTFRYRWIYAQDIIDQDGTVYHNNVKTITNRLKLLGKSTHEQLSHK